MKTAVLVTIIVALATSMAAAKPRTCGQLKEQFEGVNRDLSFDPGAVLLGVVATRPELCIPRGTILATLQAIFVHWADENPKLMRMESWACVTRAFAESFQCPKGSN